MRAPVQAGFVWLHALEMYVRMADVSTVTWYSTGHEYNGLNTPNKIRGLEITVGAQSIQIMGDDIDRFMQAMNLDAERPGGR